jgi:hypothetical protein
MVIITAEKIILVTRNIARKEIIPETVAMAIIKRLLKLDSGRQR